MKVLTKLFIVLVAVALCGCTHQRKHHGELFLGADGHYYTRTWDDNGMLWYYMYISSSNNSSYSMSPSSSSFQGGSWQRVSSTPTGLSPTKEDVTLDERGAPTDNIVDGSTVPSGDTITNTTSPGQISDDATTGSSGSSAGSESSGSSGGSDGGGSVGGSSDGGGGSSGGSDGGGGGDSGGGGDGGGGGGD